VYVPPAVTLKSFNVNASEFDRYVVRVPAGKNPCFYSAFPWVTWIPCGKNGDNYIELV